MAGEATRSAKRNTKNFFTGLVILPEVSKLCRVVAHHASPENLDMPC
jgi:hypothetical protein